MPIGFAALSSADTPVRGATISAFGRVERYSGKLVAKQCKYLKRCGVVLFENGHFALKGLSILEYGGVRPKEQPIFLVS